MHGDSLLMVVESQVFFVPTHRADPSIVAQIESNGGRNDVEVQAMWALSTDYANGEWGFFSPCTVGGGAYTTLVVAPGPC